MINWVHAVCKNWGRAQYWVLCGKGGYPTRSMLGKLMEEGVVGASCGQFTMTYPEVLTGENLVVANAVKTLPEEPRNIVTVHYVFRTPLKVKLRRLEISKDKYYRTLDDAHIHLANAIDRQCDKMAKKFADLSIA